MTATTTTTTTTTAATAATATTTAAASRGADHPHAALRDLLALPPHHPDRPAVRHQAIVAWLPLARDLAHRYAGRGEPLPDLVQTATVGLIKAIDRFDPQLGNDFPAFAVPTIVGEVKRYFRDQTWDLRVPRRLQELRRAVARSAETLTQRLGRPPTQAELAAELRLPEEQVREGIRVARAYAAASLDAPTGPAGDQAVLGELLGAEDDGLARAEERMVVAPAVAALPERSRRILALRFGGNLTQGQIAERIGISQMHVSRLLARILGELREQLRDRG
ncbi:MAG: SigB/SigF/SigG family RNA polymerase sigma factor [Micromonosporaceae bacterium]|nr:SigB/SigF/SigG family RNA polymerase sigma factor [Micromonosporaceae bacterium]